MYRVRVEGAEKGFESLLGVECMLGVLEVGMDIINCSPWMNENM